MKTITLRCLGPAKQFSPSGDIKLEVDEKATVGYMRACLMAWLLDHPLKTEMQEILNISVFATQHKILLEEESIQENTEFALIPPISGG
ncbi:MAG: hypothetical protein HY559_04170 [Gammaproteobacteria bacterium]|nr:hypothetical protein [Gammaproteobacteria bacterium]